MAKIDLPYEVLDGDCLERLKEIPDGSIDSVVCDPPYHLTSIVKRFSATAIADDTKTSKRTRERADGYARLSTGFMGQKWDGGDIAFRPDVWIECFRVLKPGGHLLAFSGSRTYHRMACAIEDAGFEIRDQIMWLYGSGFPKSHDVSKGIDKAKPASDEAKQWQGYGTALKPSHEPICIARKPLIGTVAENVLTHGTGALNIDATRIEGWSEEDRANMAVSSRGDSKNGFAFKGSSNALRAHKNGRWPANIIHDNSDEVIAAFPSTRSAGDYPSNSSTSNNVYGERQGRQGQLYTDGGSAARFFYSPKTDAGDRDAGLPNGLENKHPTVKPTNLMRYLCRLVTPKGGTVLDPFCGSGSTGRGALYEDFRFIGVELDPEYAKIARFRLQHAHNRHAPNKGHKRSGMLEDKPVSKKGLFF